MRNSLKITSALALSIFCISGFALSNDEVKSARQTIDAQYKAAMAQCKSMKDNAKDICEKEAKGQEKIARADLDANIKPGDANTLYKARLVRAEATYDVAKERCDDMNGNAKDVCKKDAEAAHVKAKEDAKVQRVEAAPAGSPAQKAANTSQARQNAAEETRDAQYQAAKERCDAMSGPEKDNCLNQAKIQFSR